MPATDKILIQVLHGQSDANIRFADLKGYCCVWVSVSEFAAVTTSSGKRAQMKF